jgi:hypothetical protein
VTKNLRSISIIKQKLEALNLHYVKRIINTKQKTTFFNNTIAQEC